MTWPDPGFSLPPRDYEREFDLPTEVPRTPDVPERDSLWVIVWRDDGSAGVRDAPEPARGPLQ